MPLALNEAGNAAIDSRKLVGAGVQAIRQVETAIDRTDKIDQRLVVRCMSASPSAVLSRENDITAAIRLVVA